MYQFNDPFTKAAGQFADAAANANRLALENAEQAFGLQFAALQDSVKASFAFAGELIEARDLDAFKAAWPKGMQVARANAERGIGVAQEVFANTLKTQEAIGALAKGQFEQAATQAQAEVEKATKAASKK